MSGLSLNPDIHHSKVFSSGYKTVDWWTCRRFTGETNLSKIASRQP